MLICASFSLQGRWCLVVLSRPWPHFRTIRPDETLDKGGLFIDPRAFNFMRKQSIFSVSINLSQSLT
jgi:hypothetical protein